MKKLLIIGIMLTAECIFAVRSNRLEEWAEDKQEVWRKFMTEWDLSGVQRTSIQELYEGVQQNLEENCFDKESDECKSFLNQISILFREDIDSFESAQKILKKPYDNNSKFLFISFCAERLELQFKDEMFDLDFEEMDLQDRCRAQNCDNLRSILYFLSKDEKWKSNQKSYIHYLQTLVH